MGIGNKLNQISNSQQGNPPPRQSDYQSQQSDYQSQPPISGYQTTTYQGPGQQIAPPTSGYQTQPSTTGYQRQESYQHQNPGGQPSMYNGYQSGYQNANVISHGQNGVNSSAIFQMLSNLVRVKGWERFYPPGRLQNLAQKISQIDFTALANKYQLSSVEIALELAKISLVDVVLYCDDSGSMIYCDNGERWNEDLQAIIKMVSELTVLFDTDGIDVFFMNNPHIERNVSNPIIVQQLMKKVQPSGVTPLGVELEKKIFMPYANHLHQNIQDLTKCKPILIVCITDGSPTDTPRDFVKGAIQRMITWLRNMNLSPGSVGLQFAQVGRDQAAQAFLDDLDNDPGIGDFVDATSYYEHEEIQWAQKGAKLTPYLYILKMLLGGFDPEWDNKD